MCSIIYPSNCFFFFSIPSITTHANFPHSFLPLTISIQRLCFNNSPSMVDNFSAIPQNFWSSRFSFFFFFILHALTIFSAVEGWKLTKMKMELNIYWRNMCGWQLFLLLYVPRECVMEGFAISVISCFMRCVWLWWWIIYLNP